VLGLTWGAIDLEAGRITVQRRVNRLPKDLGGLLVRDGAKSEAGERATYLVPMAVDALRRLRVRLREDRLKQGPDWLGADDPVAPEAFVFVTSVGTLLEPRNVSRSFDAACIRAGLRPPKEPGVKRERSDVDFHGLRHDFASLLGRLGVPLRVAKDMLGHSNELMTIYYQHSSDEDRRAAAEKVDGWLRQAVGE
jgi:integrase